MRSPARSLVFSLIAAAVVFAPLPADAACPNLRELADVRQGLREAVRCRLEALRAPGVSCADGLPATPAGALATSALALAFGDNAPAARPADPVALRTQLSCQRAIARATAGYFEEKLDALVKGAEPIRAEARARRLLDRLPDQCAGLVATDGGGTVLPVMGGACAGIIGAPGTAVPGAAVRDCIHDAIAADIASLGVAGEPQATTVILVRHAERDPGEDPPLTAEGQARAQALATALADAGVTAIFVTPFIRNQQTAAPLSLATGVPVTVVPVPPPDWPGRGHVMAAAVLAAPRGGVIVVVGHTSGFNTAVSNDLGGPAVPETYAAMNVLTLIEGQPSRTIFARYGAVSTLDPP